MQNFPSALKLPKHTQSNSIPLIRQKCPDRSSHQFPLFLTTNMEGRRLTHAIRKHRWWVNPMRDGKKCFSYSDHFEQPPASAPLWGNRICQTHWKREVLTGNLCRNSLEWRMTARVWEILNLIKKKKSFKLQLCLLYLSDCISLSKLFGTKQKKSHARCHIWLAFQIFTSQLEVLTEHTGVLKL